ncbi:MAG: hypothetical protein NUV67_05465 [archaeon]|nr:hypothetical protein [archaeon]
MPIGKPSEQMRQKLLEEELKLRSKQPEHWAKTKYRKYAKPFSQEELEQLKENEKNRAIRTGESGKIVRKAKKRVGQRNAKPKSAKRP